MRHTVTVEGTQEIDEREIEYTAQVRCGYRPAKLYGPPENCYPEESEADIEALATLPAGFENLIDEDDVLDRAWEAFHEERYEYVR